MFVAHVLSELKIITFFASVYLILQAQIHIIVYVLQLFLNIVIFITFFDVSILRCMILRRIYWSHSQKTCRLSSLFKSRWTKGEVTNLHTLFKFNSKHDNIEVNMKYNVYGLNDITWNMQQITCKEVLKIIN